MKPADEEFLETLVKNLGLRTPTNEQARVAAYPPFTVGEDKKTAMPLLVVAGAGSGKTETLSLRATYLSARHNIAGQNILGLTFTRKAAAELAERLRTRLAALQKIQSAETKDSQGGAEYSAFLDAPEATTYNAFALSIVQEFGAAAGLNPQISHLGEGAAWQLMSEVVALWPKMLAGKHKESTVVERALNLRQEIANQAMAIPEARRGLESLRARFIEARAEGKKSYVAFHREGIMAVEQRLELLEIIEEFEKQKVLTGQMDYADQVRAAIQIVETVPAAKKQLRDRYQIVFLDEFQDTSVAQMRFLSSLFHDHPVTAVGDPNQAIYGWRGASAASLLDFHPMFNKKKDVPKSVLTLSTAWRNDTAILSVANRVAAPLSGPQTYLTHSTVVKDASTDSVNLPALLARPESTRGDVGVFFPLTWNEQLEGIIDFVRKAKRRKSRVQKDKEASVAILSRRRAPLLRIVKELREVGIPAQVVGGDALLSHPIIVDLRAVLTVSSDIGASPSLLRLLTNLDLGVADLAALGNEAVRLASQGRQKERPAPILLDVVDEIRAGAEIKNLSEAGYSRVKHLGERLAEVRAAGDLSLVAQVENVRKVFAYDLEALADPSTEDISEVLDQFIDVVADYETDISKPSMEAFLDWLSAVEQREQGIKLPSVEVDPDAVQVMTIHASKGLEWDAVAIIDMAAGRFPTFRGPGFRVLKGAVMPPISPAPQSGWWTETGLLPYPVRADHQHLPSPNAWDMSQSGTALRTYFREQVGAYLEAEERRLAYVAITRARSMLYLTGSWFDTGVSARYPSVFLQEAFDLLVDGRRVISGEIARTPPKELWEKLRGGQEEILFPREPGEIRRRTETAAVRVLEEMSGLTEIPFDYRRKETLAGLADRAFSNDLEMLLEEQDQWRVSQKTAGETAPEDVLAEAAKTRPLSVTELASFAVDPEVFAGQLLRPTPTKPTAQSLLGAAFHRWIEAYLQRLSAEGGNTDEWEEEDFFSALPADEQEQLHKLKAAFTSSALPTENEIVAVEAPFTFTRDGMLIRGRIDAIYRDLRGDYWLIDWKTSQRKITDLPASSLLYYQQQLSTYVEVWRKEAANQGVGIHAQLVFVTPEGLQPLTFEQITSQLKALEAKGGAAM